MSTTTPPQVDTGSPNPIEMFWDRNRTKLRAVFYILLAGLVGYYGLRYYSQKQQDKLWSAFANEVELDVYVPQSEDVDANEFQFQSLGERLLEQLDEVSIADLQARLDATGASDLKRAYLLWLMANKAFRSKDWDTARKHAGELKTSFPKHPLCIASSFPVQVRLPVIEDKDKEEETPKARKEPEYVEPVAGSTVDRFLAEVDEAAKFVLPESFKKVAIPADAPKYKFEFENFGTMTIALMTEHAPEHCRVFEELVANNFWDGIKVDQIYNPSGAMAKRLPGQQFHFGFPSTREDDKTKWDTTKPADEEHVITEFSDLSHWQGAVAARANSEGKSEVSRLWITLGDRPDQDERRQVFAFVVEGMDTGISIVESGYERSEDESSPQGGRPNDLIKIVSVSKVE